MSILDWNTKEGMIFQAELSGGKIDDLIFKSIQYQNANKYRPQKAAIRRRCGTWATSPTRA